MNADPVSVRSWTDPGWGELIHRVEPFRHHWQKSEWWNHLGVQGLAWASAFFLLGSINAIIDLAFGNLSFDKVFRNVARIETVSLFLGLGFAMALVERWVAHMGWMPKGVEGSQAEIYTNGVYLAPYGFVGGLHPFFLWSDIRRVDVSVHKSRRYATLSLKLKELSQLGVLKVDADAIEALSAIPEAVSEGRLLASALRQAAAALEHR